MTGTIRFWKADTLQGLFNEAIKGIAKQGCLGFREGVGRWPDYAYPEDSKMPARCCVLGCAMVTTSRYFQGPISDVLDYLPPGVEAFPNDISQSALEDLQISHDSVKSPEEFVIKMREFAEHHELDTSVLSLLDAAWVQRARRLHGMEAPHLEPI